MASAAVRIALSTHVVPFCRLEQQTAMRFRSDPGSLMERVASTAMATGITVSTTLLMLAAPRSRFIPVSSPTLRLGTTLPQEQLTYIVPRNTALTLTPALSAKGQGSRASLAPQPSSTRTEQVTLPHGIVVDSAPRAATNPTRTRSSTSDAEDPWVRRALLRFHGPDSASDRVTMTRQSYSSDARTVMPASWGAIGFPRASSEPIRSDSALAVVRDKLATGLSTGAFNTPSVKQDQLDAQLRAKAAAAIAAKGAGGPIPGGMIGGGIAAPLPFGGPSRAQRERDRAINAVTAKRLAHVRQHLDSVAAARRRTGSDSLEQVADSLRRNRVQRP